MTKDDRAFPNRRTAVVTGVGAPRGIGRVMARQLAAEGWALALVDVDPQGAAEIEAELSPAAIVKAVAVDISSPDSVTAAFEAIDADLPPVVGLVNLAGVPSPVPLLELTAKDWEKVMAVNVTGSFLMLQAAARRMIDVGVGRIVNVSSIMAFDGGGTFSKGGYAAAKAAVLGLTRGAARELGPHGVTVNCIAPGPIDTDIMGGPLTDERKDAMAAGIPVGRVGTPDDIAAAISFLLSAGSGFVNGATIQVDGGKYMH